MEPSKRKPPQAPHPRRTMAIALFMFAVLAGLVLLKIGSQSEEAELARAKIEEQKARVALDAEIRQAIATHYQRKAVDEKQAALVLRVGNEILASELARGKTLSFHLLSEDMALNLFSLPTTGDVYITTALLNRMQTEGQLAAALAHGAAHVLAADGMHTMTQADGTAHPSLWQFTLEQEQAADVLMLTLMSQAGYDPNAAIGMFTILIDAYKAGADVVLFTTHPSSEDRLKRMQDAVKALYPNGIPAVLSK